MYGNNQFTWYFSFFLKTTELKKYISIWKKKKHFFQLVLIKLKFKQWNLKYFILNKRKHEFWDFFKNDSIYIFFEFSLFKKKAFLFQLVLKKIKFKQWIPKYFILNSSKGEFSKKKFLSLLFEKPLLDFFSNYVHLKIKPCLFVSLQKNENSSKGSQNICF